MKFRKRPVVIEAEVWLGDDSIIQWARNVSDGNGTSLEYGRNHGGSYLSVNTLEGKMKATIGDYVICGVNGEFYFCKPDIFHKSYEVIGENND